MPVIDTNKINQKLNVQPQNCWRSNVADPEIKQVNFQEDMTQRVRKEMVGQNAVYRLYQPANPNAVLAEINENQIQTFNGLFENPEMQFQGNYRNIINSPQWRAVYGIDIYQIQRKNFHSNQLHTVPIKGFPCRGCGIIFPLTNITIDHQAPQKGGADLAVVRAFRAFGLTAAGPSGSKGQTHIAQLAGLFGLAATPAGDGPTRYTLNNYGVIFLTLVKLSDNFGLLRAASMDFYFNLTPMCNACNSSKNNSQQTLI